MRKRKRYAAAVLAVAAGIVLSSCGVEKLGALKVGVKDNVANFGLYDEASGRYSGMEIDLAEELCDELGYGSLKLSTVAVEDRERMIDEDEVDMIIATYSATKERKKHYDFSEPYYTDYVSVMTEESSMITSISDLLGCRVGVMKNSSNMRALAEYMADLDLLPEFDSGNFSPETFRDKLTFAEYDSYDEISNALEYGDVDAFVADRSILSGYVKDDRYVLADRFAKQEYCVCTKKGSRLSEQVDRGIKKLKEDGTIQELIDKWGN